MTQQVHGDHHHGRAKSHASSADDHGEGTHGHKNGGGHCASCCVGALAPSFMAAPVSGRSMRLQSDFPAPVALIASFIPSGLERPPKIASI